MLKNFLVEIAFNDFLASKTFNVNLQVRQEKPKESRRTHRLKRCRYNHKNEDYCPHTRNDKKF